MVLVNQGVSQPLVVKGLVTRYKDKAPIQATLYFEKQPDASVTVITEATANGYHARIYYRTFYLVKISAPGFVSEYHRMDFAADSILQKEEIYRYFSLVPIQLGEILPFRDLVFDPFSFRISKESLTELNHLAEILNENPGIRIQLEGYTDSHTHSRKSTQLSRKRIKSVRAYLVARGIRSDRIRLKAMGGGKLLVRDEDLDSRKQNRRVDIRIIGL